MCLMNIDHQHNVLEINFTTSTVTLGHEIVCFILSPFRLIVVMKLRVSVVLSSVRLYKMNSTASGSKTYLAIFTNLASIWGHEIVWSVLVDCCKKLRVLHVFDEYWSSTQWFSNEYHNFDSYLWSQDRLIRFEPVSVDCHNEITCFDCIFCQYDCRKWIWWLRGPKRILQLSRYGGPKCILWYVFFLLFQCQCAFPFLIQPLIAVNKMNLMASGSKAYLATFALWVSEVYLVICLLYPVTTQMWSCVPPHMR